MRRIGEGALAGIAAGVAVGLTARLAMRLVALGVPDGVMQIPSFTLAGTAMIVTVGAVIGAPLGAVAAQARPLMRLPTAWRALAIAALLLAALGPMFFIGAQDEFVNTARVVLFLPLFLVFGVFAAVAIPVVERLGGWISDVWLALASAVAAGGAVLILFGIVTLTRDIWARQGPATTVAVLAPLLLFIVASARYWRSNAPRAIEGRSARL